MGNVASNTVNQMAFCPPPPTYRKQDVNMWLETDRGSRIPAFHIRRGYPLTVLVSHANAEEQSLYAAMLGDPDLQDEGSHSTADHHEIEEYIEELEDTDMSSPGWIAVSAV